MRISSGWYSSFRLPTALADRMRSTPSTLKPKIFALKFSSDGRIRWPMPCRGRNATRLPRSVPITYGPEGSPNGVASDRSSRSVNSAKSYSPLPPMMPMPTGTLITSGQRRNHTAFPVLLSDVARRNRGIVLEKHKNVGFDRFPVERFLGRERVHGIQVVPHDPRLAQVGGGRHEL